MARPLEAIDLISFEGPIVDALQAYSDLTDGRVTFENPGQAAKLELTPDKPNSARNSVPVHFYGEPVGDAVLIAFAPGDGTGAESDLINLSNISTGFYASRPGVVPRSKAAVHSEVHVTIAAQRVGDSQADPIIFAGSLDLLGFNTRSPRTVKKIGGLGSGHYGLMQQLENGVAANPTATLTVGYSDPSTGWGLAGERFCNPHAVINPYGDLIQVCGFLAITPEQAPRYLAALRLLGAVDPRPRAC